MKKPLTFGVAALVGAGVIGGIVGGVVASSGPSAPAHKVAIVQKTADTSTTTTTTAPAPAGTTGSTGVGVTTTTLSPDQAAASASQSATSAAQSAAAAANSATSAANSAQSVTTTTTTTVAMTTVPTVAGDDWNTAVSAIRGADLTVAWNGNTCPTDPAGPEPVTGTVPTAGSQVATGSTVDLCN